MLNNYLGYLRMKKHCAKTMFTFHIQVLATPPPHYGGLKSTTSNLPIFTLLDFTPIIFFLNDSDNYCLLVEFEPDLTCFW